MKLFYINNDGAGFADHVEVADGLTLGRLFQERMPDASPRDYLIRVNRQPAAAGEVLKEGDRVSITPVKIEGAGRSRLLRRCGTPTCHSGVPSCV